MWLRIAMVGLAGLAAAAPQLEWPGAVPEFGGSGAVVVVMDDSLSMGLEEEATLLARARSQAAAMVRSLPAGTLVGVVRIAGTATRATPGLIDEPEVALAAITACTPAAPVELVGRVKREEDPPEAQPPAKRVRFQAQAVASAHETSSSTPISSIQL